MASNKVRVNVALDKETVDALDEVARLTDSTRSELISDVLDAEMFEDDDDDDDEDDEPENDEDDDEG